MVSCYPIYLFLKLKSNHTLKLWLHHEKEKSSLYFNCNFYILQWKSNNHSVLVICVYEMKWASWFCFEEEGPNCETVLLVLLLLFYTGFVNIPLSVSHRSKFLTFLLRLKWWRWYSINTVYAPVVCSK